MLCRVNVSSATDLSPSRHCDCESSTVHLMHGCRGVPPPSGRRPLDQADLQQLEPFKSASNNNAANVFTSGYCVLCQTCAIVIAIYCFLHTLHYFLFISTIVHILICLPFFWWIKLCVKADTHFTVSRREEGWMTKPCLCITGIG